MPGQRTIRCSLHAEPLLNDADCCLSPILSLQIRACRRRVWACTSARTSKGLTIWSRTSASAATTRGSCSVSRAPLLAPPRLALFAGCRCLVLLISHDNPSAHHLTPVPLFDLLQVVHVRLLEHDPDPALPDRHAAAVLDARQAVSALSLPWPFVVGVDLASPAACCYVEHLLRCPSMLLCRCGVRACVVAAPPCN